MGPGPPPSPPFSSLAPARSGTRSSRILYSSESRDRSRRLRTPSSTPTSPAVCSSATGTKGGRRPRCSRCAPLSRNHIEVVGLQADLRALGTGIAFRADVMVAGLDNREARPALNRLSWRSGRRWVDGAIEALSGNARVFGPPDGCYECTLSDTDFEILAHRQSCRLLACEELLAGKVPTTATTASIIGGLEAQEVIKLIHQGLDGARPMRGGIVFDGANNDAYPVQYPWSASCPAHHAYDDLVVLEASVTTTAAELARSCSLDEALVELADDHVISWYCPACDSQTADGVVAALVDGARARCAVCGDARRPSLTSTIEVPSPLSELPLRSIGVPPDDVLAIRHKRGYYYRWLRSNEGLPTSWTDVVLDRPERRPARSKHYARVPCPPDPCVQSCGRRGRQARD